MTELRDSWKTGRFQSAVYDFGVQHRYTAAIAARALWNYDVGRLWKSISELTRLPDGSAVLDVPCGGGIALRAVRGKNLHYVAADISPVMLHRARHHPGAALVQTDINALPFPDASFDACVTYNGLHCLPDPATAVAELARVLRPGGTLRGTMVVRGAGRDPLIAMLRRRNAFGPGGTTSDLRRWLTDAGLTDLRLDLSGAVAGFTARTAG